MATAKKTTKKVAAKRVKAGGKGEHIVARSITLEDAKGTPRIFMDAGDGDGYATICLFGEGERSIQICTAPDGGLYISLLGQRCASSATIAMTADEKAGLSILDDKGQHGSLVGSLSPSGEHKVVLCREGMPVWSAPER